MHSNQNYRIRLKYLSFILWMLGCYLVAYLLHNDRKPLKGEVFNCAPSSELLFPIPENCRQYHTCNYGKIPFVHTELASAKLLYYSNKSLIRFGDLDIDLIQGTSWPIQSASRDLSYQLYRAFHSSAENMFIGIYDPFSSQSRTSIRHQRWMQNNDRYRNWLMQHTDSDREYLSTILSSPYYLNQNTSCIPVDKVYKVLRNIWRGRDIVLLRGDNGQVYDYDVFDTARSQKILYVPPRQAWSSHEKVLSQLLAEQPESLFILCAGPIAKVLGYELTLMGRRALDLGHLPKDYNLYRSGKHVQGHFFND